MCPFFISSVFVIIECFYIGLYSLGSGFFSLRFSPRSRSRANRTQYPENTCSGITERSVSNMFVWTSSSRITGPGCITMASFFASCILFALMTYVFEYSLKVGTSAFAALSV